MKYEHSHDIIIGGDINEDLNKHKPNNTRKAYLKKFINEFGLQYENVENTFTNSKGCDCSEIDYFIHNIPQQQIIAEKAIIQIDTNTSDHYPISMSFKWEHNKDDNLKTPNPKGKIKWKKLDKDLYRAMVTEKSTALYERMRITTISSQEAITQVNTHLPPKYAQETKLSIKQNPN